MPTVDGWQPDVAGRAEAGTRAFVAHGRNDQVMDVEFARRATALLEGGGLPVEYHESDAAHHIDPAHVPAAVRWVAETLPVEASRYGCRALPPGTVAAMSTAPFRHDEAGRTLLFGRGVLDDGLELLGDRLTLLSTPRALAAAPEVAERAERVIEVPDGKVDAVAGDLLGADLAPVGMLLIALGGGRVIDVAKALAAAAGVGALSGASAGGSGAPDAAPRAVAAIPTTLSGAEMTGGHRHARGVPADARHVRTVAGDQRPGAERVGERRRAGGEQRQRARPRPDRALQRAHDPVRRRRRARGGAAGRGGVGG